MSNNNNNNNNNNLNELQHFSTDFRRGTVATEDMTRSGTVTSRRQIDIHEKNNDNNNNNNNNNNGKGLSSSSSIKSNSPLPNDLASGLINSYKLDSKRFEYEREQKQERQEEEQEQEQGQGQGQGQESSPKEINPMVAWQEEVDRFSNFVTKKQMTHLQLYSAVETILQGFQTSYNSKNTDSHIKKDSENSTFSKIDFAYTLFNNLFLCKITENADQTAEFSVGVYTYQEDKCLLDVQKLEGDHFVFTHFFENLKTALRDQDIIHTPTIKKEVLDIYGLDIDIGLEIFN